MPTPHGFTVRYRGRLLYSSAAPKASAVARASATPIQEDTLYFVPSLGLGYGLRELVTRCPASSHVLCAETDQRIMALAATFDDPPLPRSDQLTIVRCTDANGLLAVLDRVPRRLRRVVMVPLCGGYALSTHIYREMQDALASAIGQFWQNEMTRIHMARLWIKNCLDNLAILPATDVMPPPMDCPIVVVGAGPTLDAVTKDLRTLSRGALILATDTSLSALAAAGIHPHGIVVMEGQHANIGDFIGSLDPDAPLFADLSSHPGALRLFRGSRFLVASRFAELSLYRRLGERGLLPPQIPPLGSVGITAVNIALRLTSSTVVCCALDFCYSGDQTHARDTPHHRRGLRTSGRSSPVLSTNYSGIRSRPLIRLRRPGRPDTVTDLVLQSYAGTLEGLVGSGNANRVVTITPQVRDLGIPLVSLAEIPLKGSAPRILSNLRTGERPSEKVGEFVQREASILQESLMKLRDLAYSPGSAEATPAADQWEALAAIDYVFAHFPDAPDTDGAPRGIPPGFGARVLREGAVYLHRLQRLVAYFSRATR